MIFVKTKHHFAIVDLVHANVEKDSLALTVLLTHVEKQSVETTVHAHFDTWDPLWLVVPYSYPKIMLVFAIMAGLGQSVILIHAIIRKKVVLDMESALL